MPQSNESTNQWFDRKSTTPYPIHEQIHDVVITNSQTYIIIRLSMHCPSGVIILNDKLALPSERFVSLDFLLILATAL